MGWLSKTKPKEQPRRPESHAPAWRHPALVGLTEREMGQVYQSGTVRRYSPADTIPLDGHPGHTVVLIMDGAARMVPGPDKGVLNKGDLLDARAHPGATLVVIEPLTLQAVDVELLEETTMRHILATLSRQPEESPASRKERELTAKIEQLSTYARMKNEEEGRRISQSETIKKLVEGVPKLPLYASQLVTMLTDENVRASEVVDLARLDPSLVGVLLKTVNSPYYNLKNKVSDFQHAVVLLGFDQVYRLVVNMGVGRTMPDTQEFRELMFHANVVSFLAYEVAYLAGVEKPGKAATLALLHDIGQSVIYLMRQEFPRLALLTGSLDPARVGGLLLTHWGLPAGLCRAVTLQQYPEFTPPEKLDESVRESCAILYLAHTSYELLSGTPEARLGTAFLSDYSVLLGLGNRRLPELLQQRILPSLERRMTTLPDQVRSFLRESAARLTPAPQPANPTLATQQTTD